MPPPTPFESDPTLFALCLHLKETTSSFLLSFSLLSFSRFFYFLFSDHLFSAYFLSFTWHFWDLSFLFFSFFFLMNVNRMVLALLQFTTYKDGFFFPPSRTRLLGFYPSLPWRRDLAVLIATSASRRLLNFLLFKAIMSRRGVSLQKICVAYA